MNIPSFNFKALTQKLSVIKNNSSLLWPIGIGLVAIVLFIPNQLLSSKLKQQVESDSVGKARTIQSIEVVPLEQLEQKEKSHERYAQDANQIALLAEQTTQRELLSYQVFLDPNTRSASTLIFDKFGQRFRESVDRLLVEAKAGRPPTEAELDKALEQSPTGSRTGAGTARRSLYSRSPRSMPYQFGYGFGKAAEINRTIVAAICSERAESASVYALATDLNGYEFWGAFKYAGMDEAVADCWYWQLGYWVIEDVMDTVESMNSGSNSVFTSPVKRVLGVSFSLGEGGRRRGFYTGRTGPRQKDTGERPRYVRSVEDAFIEPCTQRFCDGDIDVIHFRVRVVVSADAVLKFMEHLCSAKQHKFRGYPTGDGPEQVFKHNQITILESSNKAIDPQSPDHYYYHYGEDAVVELDVICEYVFNKVGYDLIKPQPVKDALKAEIQTGKRR
jgi:hypothetical protein